MSTASVEIIRSRSDAETVALGAQLGSLLSGGEVVGLMGPLGAGKTRFVRGLASGAGVHDLSAVKSPTFVLHQIYAASRFRIHHLDAYRLSGAREFSDLDVPGSFEPGDVLVVEWADRIEESLAPGVIRIGVVIPPGEDRNVRDLRFEAGDAISRRLLDDFMANFRSGTGR